MLVYPLEMAIYEGVKPFSDPYSYSVGGGGCAIFFTHWVVDHWGVPFCHHHLGGFPPIGGFNRTSETRVDLDHCKGTWLILAVFLVHFSFNGQC